jgi:hypothetical protein
MNQLARALYAPMLADPRRPAKHHPVRLSDPAAEDFFIDYDQIARDAAAMLRLEAGRNPHDEELVALVGELSTRSELSGTAGHPTTCAFTARAASGYGTRWSGNSIWTSKRLSCLPKSACSSTSTPPPQAPPVANSLKLLASWTVSQEGLPSERATPKG